MSAATAIENTEGAPARLGSLRIVGMNGEKFTASKSAQDALIAKIDKAIEKAGASVPGVLTHPSEDTDPSADVRGSNVGKNDRRYIPRILTAPGGLDAVVRKLEAAGVIVEN